MAEKDQFDSPEGQESASSGQGVETSASEPPPGMGGPGDATKSEPGASVMTEGFSTQLLDVHGEIAEALKQQAAAVGAQSRDLESAGEGISNVQGVAIGLGKPGDGPPGEPTLTLYVAERQSVNELREQLVDGQGVRGVGDLPMTIRQSGEFEAQPHTFKARPAPCGISVGHFRITAGTIGCLSIGRSAPRNSRLMVLSNNHVLADSNAGAYFDSVIQPGAYDGGQNPGDQIAVLESFVPLKFGGAVNYVDAANAWAWPDRVRKEHIYRYGSGFAYFRMGNTPQYPTLGALVGKSGRTTQLTQGRIVDVNWAGNVNYGTPGLAHFAGQFVVQGVGGSAFSAGGDSGSAIWRWENGLPPVGLLFAGGGGYTIGSPMPWVTYLLDINLYT